MAMPTARLILEIHPPEVLGMEPRVVVGLPGSTSEAVVRLSALTRAELGRAVRHLAWCYPAGNATWSRSFTPEQGRAEVVRVVSLPGYMARRWSAEPTSEPSTSPEPVATSPEPTLSATAPSPEPFPAPSAPSGIGAVLEQALGALVAQAVEAAQSAAGASAEVAQALGALAQRVEALEARTPTVLSVTLPSGAVRTVAGRVHAQAPEVVEALAIGRGVYVYGPAGTGKSHLAAQAAEALGVALEVQSCSSGMTEYSLSGFRDATGHVAHTAFRRAYETGALFLLDEADAAPADALTWLNGAVAGSGCSFPDGWVQRHPEFRLMLAGNTSGEGPTAAFPWRVELDKATRDRVCRIALPLDEALEAELLAAECGSVALGGAVQRLFSAMRGNAESAGFHSLNLGMRRSRDAAALLALPSRWTLERVLEVAVFADSPRDVRDRVLSGADLGAVEVAR